MKQLTLDYNSTLNTEQFKAGLPKTRNGGVKWYIESFMIVVPLMYSHVSVVPGQVWTGSRTKYKFICDIHGEYEAGALHVLVESTGCQCKGCDSEKKVESAGTKRAPRATKEEKDLAVKLKLEGLGVTEISRRLRRSQKTISRWMDPKQAEYSRQCSANWRSKNRERAAASVLRWNQFEHGKMSGTKSRHKRRGIEYHCIDVVFLPDHPDADPEGFVSYNIWDLVKHDKDSQEMMSFDGANEDVAKRKQQQIGLARISGEAYSLEHLVPLSQGGLHCPENFANRALTLNVQKGAKRLEKDDALFVKRLFN